MQGFNFFLTFELVEPTLALQGEQVYSVFKRAEITTSMPDDRVY